MKKRKLWFFSLLIGSAFALTACSSDDSDDNGTGITTQVAPMQVAVVFEPGQLGDQGYADRILRGLTQIKQDEEAAAKSELDVKYFSLDDATNTQKAISQWVQQRNNPYVLQASYERRLLVLTKATQLEWLNGLNLNENDEVLLLNTDKEAIASSSLGNRIHILNISAAAAAKKYFEGVDEMERQEAVPVVEDLGLIRLNDKQVYADSISEAFKEHYADKREFQTIYFDEERDMDSNMTTASYRFAKLFSDYEMMGFYFTIIDLGSANMGYDYYLFNNEKDYARTLVLDAEINRVLPRFAICRKFDEAMINWVNRWKTTNVGGMPQVEWHGAWDGYVDDDIDF